MKEKKINMRDIKAFVKLQNKRFDLNLNPICISCGRVMKTKRKDKNSGEYYCICNPRLVICIG